VSLHEAYGTTAVSVVDQPCRTVRFMCYSLPPIPYYTKVYVGMKLGNCVVKFASPNPCIVTPATSITRVDSVSYRVEPLDHNVIVRIEYAGRQSATEYYAYPREVWDYVSKLMEPLNSGKSLREPGVLFIGPPGTGKSSMLNILGDIYGLYRIDITPEAVLSKFVGESEQRIRDAFTECEENIPCMITFDEAEWILAPRASRQVGGGGEEVGVNLTNFVLRKLQEYSRRKVPSLVAFATNVGEEDVDPAFLRSGRVRKPVLVPLPDYEAVYNLAKYLFPELSDSERDMIATSVVNAGLSMADALSVFKDYVETKTIKISSSHRYRGYRRLAVHHELIRFKEKLEPVARLFKKAVDYGNARIYVPSKYTVAVPLVVTAVGVNLKHPAVIVDDEKYLVEALNTIEMLKSVSVFIVDYMPEDVPRYVAKRYNVPMIFIGQRDPGVPAVSVDVVGRVDLRDMAELVIDFWRIPLDERERRSLLENASRRTREDLVKYLDALVLSGDVDLASSSRW